MHIKSLFLIAIAAATLQGQSNPQPPSFFRRSMGSLEDHMGIARENGISASPAAQFRPLTQHERTSLFLRGFVNPWGFVDLGVSATLDHRSRKPEEWGQGSSGFGKRLANIQGQYLVSSTAAFGLSSVLHEDNRYFASGKRSILRRSVDAAASSVLARHNDGSLHISASQIGGVAAGAFAARLWLPPSEGSLGDAAVSFGLSLAGNVTTSLLKEFLPDILHCIGGK